MQLYTPAKFQDVFWELSLNLQDGTAWKGAQGNDSVFPVSP